MIRTWVCETYTDDPDGEEGLERQDATKGADAAVRYARFRTGACAVGGGPKQMRAARTVRYRRGDLIAWLDAHLRASTSSAAA